MLDFPARSQCPCTLQQICLKLAISLKTEQNPEVLTLASHQGSIDVPLNILHNQLKQQGIVKLTEFAYSCDVSPKFTWLFSSLAIGCLNKRMGTMPSEHLRVQLSTSTFVSDSLSSSTSKFVMVSHFQALEISGKKASRDRYVVNPEFHKVGLPPLQNMSDRERGRNRVGEKKKQRRERARKRAGIEREREQFGRDRGLEKATKRETERVRERERERER